MNKIVVFTVFGLLWFTSCTTSPVAHPGGGDVRISPETVYSPSYQGAAPTVLPTAPGPARWVLISPDLPLTSGRVGWYPRVSELDLSVWPYGWVADVDQARRLGVPDRFWSDQKPLWTTVLDPDVLPSTAIRTLERILKNSGSSEERTRTVWHLWLAYHQASLFREARLWLDKAAAINPSPVVTLEQAWDDAFRLGDFPGAIALFRSCSENGLVDDDKRKAGLLRQRLFLGSKSLAGVGADDNISTMTINNDDLWVGTWDGAVVRWSLVTDQCDLILGAGSQVSPIKILTSTDWFIYIFQDKSLLRYSKIAGSWKTFDYPPGWTGLRVQGVVADGEESLWVATLGQGLWKWDKGNWNLIDDQGGGPFLNSLAPDGQGGFWIGTKDKGLWNWKDGVWSPVLTAKGPAPVNISVVQPSPDGDTCLVGTWGEGLWTLEHGILHPLSGGHEFVVGAVWDEESPVWATLDEGIVSPGPDRVTVLGPLDGVPSGGVSALSIWNHRLLWGTTGQGIGWWSGNENPTVHR